MKKEITDTILVLTKKAENSLESTDALKFSQAALNLAQTLLVLNKKSE